MSSRDSWLSFSIYLAPFDHISPLAVGCFRARNGAVVLHEGENRSPWERDAHANAEIKARKEKIPNSGTLPGILIAEPIGCPGMTIIEEAGNLDIFGFIARMSPMTTCLAFESLLDTKSRQNHVFAVRKGDENLREVVASQNTDKNGWNWVDYGKLTAWEAPEHYRARYPRQRLDRGKLLDIAAATGVDPLAFLNGREMKRSVYVVQYDGYDPDAPVPPSEAYMDETRKAVSLGMGEMEDEQTWEERKDYARLSHEQTKAAKAFDRAIYRAKTVASVAEALRTELAKRPGSTEDWDKRYCYEVLAKIQRAINAAHRIDLDDLETRRMEKASVDHATKAGITLWSQSDIDELRVTMREIKRPKLLKDKFDKMLKDAITLERLLALTKVAIKQEDYIRHEVRVESYICNILGKAASIDDNSSITDQIAALLDDMNAARHPTKSKSKISTSIRLLNVKKKSED